MDSFWTLCAIQTVSLSNCLFILCMIQDNRKREKTKSSYHVLYEYFNIKNEEYTKFYLIFMCIPEISWLKNLSIVCKNQWIFIKEESKEFDFKELVKAFIDKGWFDLGHFNFFLWYNWSLLWKYDVATNMCNLSTLYKLPFPTTRMALSCRNHGRTKCSRTEKAFSACFLYSLAFLTA